MSRARTHPVVAVHLLIVLVLFGLQFVLPPFHHGMMARILTLATFAVGYNLLLGYTGLMSLGHAMFFASGMYATGLTIYYLGLSTPAGLALGPVAGALTAFLIGLLALRTSGVAFLIVTMMFAQVFFLITLYLNPITGGDQGLVLTGRLQPIALGRLELALSEPAVKYNLALTVFSGCFLLSLWLMRSPIGRVLIAVRENEDRTQMLGYDTFRYRLLSLVVSGAVSGLAGSTYTLLFSYLGSSFASILYSIFPLLWTLVGGVGTTVGPLIGTALMTYLVDVTSGLTSGYLLVVGAALIVLIMWMPAGIAGGLRTRWWRWLP